MLRQCVLTLAVRRCSLRRCLQFSDQQLRHSSYRAVIFDMYGVLLPSPIALATEFERQHGVPIGTVGRTIRAGGRDGIWQRFMRGELEVQEFTHTFTQICSERAGCPVPIGSLYSALTSGPMRQPVPVMLEALHRIRQRGLKTALLSNNFLQPDGQPFLPLDPALFDVVVLSVLEGISKPDRQIFEVCLSRLGVASQHTVFLDDLIFNVQAATHLGITAVQVKEPVVAVEQLEGLLGFALRPLIPKTPQRSQGSQTPTSQPITERLIDTQRTTEHLSDSRPRGEKQTYIQPITNKLTNSQPIRAQQAGSQPVTEQLADYLRSQLHLNISDTVSMQPIRPWLHLLPSGGQQQQHFLVRTQQQGIMGTSSLDTEVRVLEVLRGSGVPVPTMVHYCQNPHVLGGPFLLMEFCGDGRGLTDPALLGHTPSERKAVYEAVIQTLCCIHRLTHTLHTHQLNLPVLSVCQQVELWIRRYRALQNHSQPIEALQNSSQPITAMERLCTWLPLHLPSKHTQTLLHGDYSCSSVWLHAEHSEVVCVSDWSHAAIGDPLMDLSTFISSLPGLGGQGFPSPEQLIGQYCEWMGQELCADWRFYMSLQFFRHAVLEQEEVATEFQALQQTKGTEQRPDCRVEHCDWLSERMAVVERRAELAWDFATQEGFRLFKH